MKNIKKKLINNKLEKINEYFTNDKEKMVKKILLTTIVRRFISRFLIGKK